MLQVRVPADGPTARTRLVSVLVLGYELLIVGHGFGQIPDFAPFDHGLIHLLAEDLGLIVVGLLDVIRQGRRRPIGFPGALQTL